MKKVVCVGHIGGRVGSSMVMGLLKQSGYDVGNVSDLVSPQNPKGFFEITASDTFLRKHYPFMKTFMPMSEWETIMSYTKAAKKEFNKVVSTWFNSKIIAIKCPYYFPHLLFDETWDVRLIGLIRKRKHQVKSIEAMNTKKGDFGYWLDRWGKVVFENMDSPPMFEFEEWIRNPYQTYLTLCDKIEPNIIMEEHQVLDWVDKKLVNHI
jgi:hypothetical protein